MGGGKGYVTRMECKSCLEELHGSEFELEHIEILYKEFDHNADQNIDYQEFTVMHGYLKELKPGKKDNRRSSIDINSLFSMNPYSSINSDLSANNNYNDRQPSTA